MLTPHIQNEDITNKSNTKYQDNLTKMHILNKIDLIQTDIYSLKRYSLGCALAENEKNNQREPWKRMTKQIRSLLENMFHAGTVDNNKISGEKMYEELLKRA
ncbi:hypothetical protein C2G38_2034415 [Gigaspora rosea]|uniref:Uncharacterized protein n=1 Tax=Gigaspora rosea TaxID=44941 RepID=A0A397VHG3_9GLOM|nr:hypothetical protein C2G38_2034415 [Gigaspora rosea]